jgi:hypothetical protein
MFRKLVSAFQVCIVVGLAVTFAVGLYVVSAQSPSSGPDTATAPPTGSVTATVGSRAWYKFDYTGDGSEILIRMAISPSLSAGFGVWTQDNVRAWAAGGAENPVGRGSVNNALGGDLVWAGNFTIAGTYYVVVDQMGPNASSYTLSITGKSVSLPAATPMMTAVATGTSATAPTTAAPTGAATAMATSVATMAATAVAQPTGVATPVSTAVVAGGNGPSDALSIRGTSTMVPVGGRTWYSFNYTGDRSEILVRMSVSPSLSAGFMVLTSDGVKAWQSNGTFSPIGRGSVNNALGGDLVWAGNFTIPGTYYVVVEQSGTNIGYYTLQISGTGVSG